MTVFDLSEVGSQKSEVGSFVEHRYFFKALQKIPELWLNN